MNYFPIGQDFLLSFTITQTDGKTPELHANISDVRALVYVGSTEVGKFTKVAASGYELLKQETEDGTYTIKIPGDETKDWKSKTAITIEVHQFFNDEGTTRKQSYTAIAFDETIPLNSKSESV